MKQEGQKILHPTRREGLWKKRTDFDDKTNNSKSFGLNEEKGIWQKNLKTMERWDVGDIKRKRTKEGSSRGNKIRVRSVFRRSTSVITAHRDLSNEVVKTLLGKKNVPESAHLKSGVVGISRTNDKKTDERKKVEAPREVIIRGGEGLGVSEKEPKGTKGNSLGRRNLQVKTEEGHAKKGKESSGGTGGRKREG